MKFEIFEYRKVESTNDTAISLIKNYNKKKGCVFAANQTSARGTKGRKWISEEGNFSIVPNRIQFVFDMFYELIFNMLNDVVGAAGKNYFP